MKQIRQKIDSIDVKISKLLDERAKCVRDIGKLKKVNKEQVFAPERESQVINKIVSLTKKNGFSLNAKINIFREIMAASRAMQKPLRICYLGPKATFTHLAAVRQFSNDCTYSSALSIPQVFREVSKGRVDYGVVPIENSTEGIVTHTLDMFFDSETKICAEILMDISHNLLSGEKNISDIKKVYSHPQALAQCGIWLEENLPRAQHIEVSSTARAAELAKKEKKAAAIASSMAAGLYKLNLIEQGIEDNKENITRFFIIGKESSASSKDSKTTIMFSVKDRVGALHDMLIPFKKYSINMTKIESRPSKIKAWEYIFFVDFIGAVKSPKVIKTLKELQKDCVFLKVLGSYPRAKRVISKA